MTSADNTGTSISEHRGRRTITDADGTAVTAIAVTAVDNTNGVWQYSTDNGTTWTAFGSVSASTARLLDGTLTGNDTQKIRFVPTLNYNGSGLHHLPRLGQIERHGGRHGQYQHRQWRHNSLFHSDRHRLDHHHRRSTTRRC